MKKIFYCLIGLLCNCYVHASDNIVLITIDGLRWQEVFHGLDMTLAKNEKFAERSDDIIEQFSGTNSAKKLLPFFHETLARQGVLYGNKNAEQCMKLSNPWYFSYPGYNEILTGKADPKIDTNGKIENPNVSYLEWLNSKKNFRNKVYAFASWDVFPFILNEKRSRLPVNAGFRTANFPRLSDMEKTLNTLQPEVPSPWKTVRLDAFTHHYAVETLKKRKPRALYISYGETDDFAHDGHYDQYIFAAHRTDQFIADIWNTLQSMRQYRDNTTLIITTDHGRGSTPEDWQHHASKEAMKGYMKSLAKFKEGIVGSDDVWFAAIGPDVKRGTFKSSVCLSSNQIAATAVKAVGFNWGEVNSGAGVPMNIFE